MRALPAIDLPPHTASQPAHPTGRRQPRTRLALLVGLGVLALHAVLIQHLAPVDTLGNTPMAAARRPGAVQVRSLTAPTPAPGLPLALQAGPQVKPTAAAPPAVSPRPTALPAAAATAHAATHAATRTATPLAAPAATSTATSTGADPDDATDASAANPAAAAGAAPPLYPTLVPNSTTLRYAVRHPHQAGVASLVWQHDGQHYQLQLDSRNSAGQPLLAQTSQGVLDSTGLAPDRFVDRRRDRGWRAVNFRRDVGRISFSGPPVDYPAWPGAQDSLSWLVQLAAIQAAAAVAGQPPLPAHLWVVNARGGAAVLRFEPINDTADSASLQHWQHQPVPASGVDRWDAQRIDLWLDPALGHWPVRLRYTQLRSGDVTEWLHLPSPPQAP